MKHFSNFGLMLVGLYVVVAVIVFTIPFGCHTEYCKVVGIAPFFPWFIFLIGRVNGLSAVFAIAVSGVFNAVIIYFIGHAIGAIVKRFFKGSKNPEIS